jgi:hypothetical protein
VLLKRDLTAITLELLFRHCRAGAALTAVFLSTTLGLAG